MNFYERTHGFSDFPEDFENCRFDRINPERHRELSRKGGVKSGESRRRKAIQRDAAFDMLAAYSLAASASEEYRAAVAKVMKDEAKKRRRRRKPK